MSGKFQEITIYTLYILFYYLHYKIIFNLSLCRLHLFYIYRICMLKLLTNVHMIALNSYQILPFHVLHLTSAMRIVKFHASDSLLNLIFLQSEDLREAYSFNGDMFLRHFNHNHFSWDGRALSGIYKNIYTFSTEVCRRFNRAL